MLYMTREIFYFWLIVAVIILGYLASKFPTYGKTKPKQYNNLELYHGQIKELIKSIEGKTLAGKVFKNNQGIKDSWFRKAEDLLLKMVDIDANSTYTIEIRNRLNNLHISQDKGAV